MSISKLQGFYGFTRMPFGRDLAPGMLHRHAGHGEAAARITWAVSEKALGVITGEVGVGKTVALRAAVAGLDPTSHHVVYVANPTFGTRGLYVTLVQALGATPRVHKADLMAQTQRLLAAEEQERRRRVVLLVDEAHLLTPEQLEAILGQLAQHFTCTTLIDAYRRWRHEPGAERPVLGITSTRRVVTIALDASQQTSVKVGDPVTITMPDGSTTPGRVSFVGTVWLSDMRPMLRAGAPAGGAGTARKLLK